MKRKILLVAAAMLVLGIVLYVSRGPDVSNMLMRLMLPELESATGRKFVAQRMYVNLFPLFVEIRGLKSFDNNGEKILDIPRVKGYVGLFGLVKKKVIIRRLVLREPDIITDRKQIEDISAHIRQYLARETKTPVKVEVRSVSAVNGSLSYRDDDYSLALGGFDGEVVLNKAPQFVFLSRKAVFNKKGLNEVKGSMEAVLYLKGKRVDLKKLRISSDKSELRASGSVNTENLASKLQTQLTLYIDTVKRIFGLKRNGEGQLEVKGELEFKGAKPGIGSLFANVKFKGDLFLETLMELLQVKERIAGHVSIDGFLKGPVNNLYGEGKGALDKGDIYGVPIDSLNCKLVYQNSALKLLNGDARLLGGRAFAEAMLRLPVVNYFEVRVKGSDLSSEGLLKLVGLNRILREGKANVSLETSGSLFNPQGSFSYRSAAPGPDVLGRVKEVRGDYSMRDGDLSFENMIFATDHSKIFTAGTVDLNKNTLTFKGTGETADIGDLLSPYFTGLSGPAHFSHAVSGSLADPDIGIDFSARQTSLATKNFAARVISKVIAFDNIDGELDYKKERLVVKHLSAAYHHEKITASGTILFPHAASLFDLRKPDFNLNVSSRNMDINTFAGLFTSRMTLNGFFNADFSLTGTLDSIRLSGDVHARDLALSDLYAIDSADGQVSYDNGTVHLKSLRFKKGSSAVDVSGAFGPNNKFSIEAAGKSVRISDIVLQKQREKLQTRFKELFRDNLFDTISVSNVRITGSGTVESPSITVRGEINAGLYRGHPLGSGDILGELNGKHATVTARLLDRKIVISGEAELSGSLPWSASADLQSARYDFIAAGFFNEVPEDLLINLRGNIAASGDKDHINLSARISNAHVYLYGTAFTNSSDILLKLENNKLSVGSLSMNSENSQFRLTGSAVVGSSYDLLIEGSSALAPFKAFSRSIETINGNASFVCSLTGDWNNPKINGDMEVSDGVIGLKNLRYRLSSVSAYLYFDENRIMLDKAAGKLSGGDATFTGAVYLEKFGVKSFLFNTSLKDITASVSKNFTVNFNADLNYRGTLASQTLLGDIQIQKAKYAERVEWKSWILGLRQKERPRVESSRLDNTNLNIRVSGSNLVIDNNVAKASAKMDILLRGTLGQPAIVGTLQAKEGLVYFRGNSFNIVQAAVDFADPNKITPYFNIIAETKVKSYTIRLNLNGYINDFNLSVSSDPYLAEADIFSLLTVGQVSSNLKGLEGGIGAGEAASFLTGKLQDVFEERLRAITGLDFLSVEPSAYSKSALTTTTSTSSLSKSTGTISPRVTVVKRLLGDKLYATYSAAAGSGEEQLWKLEYILGQNVSLVGDRDELGSIGGDIKFHFRFK
jgi:autotransporter translocation and assembly factor TamB